MFKIDGKKITLTRGDTFRADIVITNADGTQFNPGEEDTITFTMRQSYSSAIVIQKTITDLVLEILPEDTAELNYGSYVYDIELTYANGDVDTFISKGTLVLTEEVTYA